MPARLPKATLTKHTGRGNAAPPASLYKLRARPVACRRHHAYTALASNASADVSFSYIKYRSVVKVQNLPNNGEQTRDRVTTK